MLHMHDFEFNVLDFKTILHWHLRIVIDGEFHLTEYLNREYVKIPGSISPLFDIYHETMRFTI